MDVLADQVHKQTILLADNVHKQGVCSGMHNMATILHNQPCISSSKSKAKPVLTVSCHCYLCRDVCIECSHIRKNHQERI